MGNAAREASLQAIRTQSEIRVILISFRAGSTGLNLTCCNRVILCDLWWNPQIEEQAFDRAHRLGQAKDVYVYKLSISGTVEERILALQEKKRALAKAALDGSKYVALLTSMSLSDPTSRLSLAELRFLFRGT